MQSLRRCVSLLCNVATDRNDNFIFAELRLDARDGAMCTVIVNFCPTIVNFGCGCACLSSLWFSSKRLS